MSTLAGFLKDWISDLFGKYSGKLREKQSIKAHQREIIIEALATNDVYLVLSMTRLLGQVIISFILMLLYLTLPAMLELKEIICSAIPLADKCSFQVHLLAERSIIIIGILTMFANFKASSRFDLVLEGFKRYRDRHGLPPVV